MGVRKQKYVAPRRCFPASAYVILTAVQAAALGMTIWEMDIPKDLKAGMSS